MKKILISLLLVVIATGVAIGGWFLYKSFISKAAVEKTAILSIGPASGTYKKGNTFAANIKIDTGGQTIGTINAHLTFDKDRLQIASLDENDSILKSFGSKIYKNDEGTLAFMGSTTDPMSEKQGTFNGSNGQVIKVNFKVKDNAANGTAEFKFVEGTDPTKGTLVNKIAEGGEKNSANILKEVKNASYTIGSGGGEQPGKPAAPKNLTATGGNYSITLKWDTVSNATGYKVYFGDKTGNYTTGSYDAGNKTTAVFGESEGVVYATRYYFVVRAYNNDGESDNSNEANAKALIMGDLDYDKDVDANDPEAIGDFHMWINYWLSFKDSGKILNDQMNDADYSGKESEGQSPIPDGDIDLDDFATWVVYWNEWTQGNQK